MHRTVLHLLIGFYVAALCASARVLVGIGVVALLAEGVLMGARRAVVEAGAHGHTQRGEAAPGRRSARLLPPLGTRLPLLLDALLGAPHEARSLLHLGAQVEPHLGEARTVRVATPHAAQRRLARVQVAVLQQELILRLSARDQCVRPLVVPGRRGHIISSLSGRSTPFHPSR